MGTDDGLVHREVMELQATPAQVREFVLTPERILDYYPAPLEGGVFEAGRSIWCRGEMGVSMLERIEAESSDDCVVMLVTTAIGLEPPYSPESIVAATTFTMVEDWALAESSGGTTLTQVVARHPGNRRTSLPARGCRPRVRQERERDAGGAVERGGTSQLMTTRELERSVSDRTTRADVAVPIVITLVVLIVGALRVGDRSLWGDELFPLDFLVRPHEQDGGSTPQGTSPSCAPTTTIHPSPRRGATQAVGGVRNRGGPKGPCRSRARRSQ